MDLTPRRTGTAPSDHSWLATDHGVTAALPITLDLTKFSQSTHYPDGYIPSGTKLGIVEATGEVGLYDNAASDGRQVLEGFLLDNVVARPGGSPIGALYWHGAIKADRLPFPIDAAGVADLAGQIKVLNFEGGS